MHIMHQRWFCDKQFNKLTDSQQLYFYWELDSVEMQCKTKYERKENSLEFEWELFKRIFHRFRTWTGIVSVVFSISPNSCVICVTMETQFHIYIHITRDTQQESVSAFQIYINLNRHILYYYCCCGSKAKKYSVSNVMPPLC